MSALQSEIARMRCNQSCSSGTGRMSFDGNDREKTLASIVFNRGKGA
jgi:hypothetical protein